MASNFCRVPGCWTALAESNKSGVCRAHNHALKYCFCPECVLKNGTRIQKTWRDIPAKAVSLPKAPWEVT